jgi:hypothetical protein
MRACARVAGRFSHEGTKARREGRVGGWRIGQLETDFGRVGQGYFAVRLQACVIRCLLGGLSFLGNLDFKFLGQLFERATGKIISYPFK